jgi:hypothetical protein
VFVDVGGCVCVWLCGYAGVRVCGGRLERKRAQELWLAVWVRLCWCVVVWVCEESLGEECFFFWNNFFFRMEALSI